MVLSYAMRSAAFRATIGATAWIALGVAAVLLVRSEQQLSRLTASLRTFDLRAREATDALVEARVSQQAYVAAGQGIAFWMPKVTANIESAQTALGVLRESAGSAAQTPLEEAAATTAEFAAIENRVRDYLKSSQQLMAGDVIFTEGVDAAANAAHQVQAAREAEREAYDANAASIRQQEATIAGAAAAVAGLAVLLLAPTGRQPTPAIETAREVESEIIAHAAPVRAPAPPPAPVPAPPPVPERGPSMVKTAATLATEFGRVRDVDELRRILGKAAEVMDASGVMVWMGSTAGSDLRVVLAHGYGGEVLARIPAVPRTADNAAAKAYRAGTLQIVLSRPGGSAGAVVAPIMTADGCIGALSAEIRHGAETSEAVQAFAEIAASHLAGVLAQGPAEIAEPRAAQG